MSKEALRFDAGDFMDPVDQYAFDKNFGYEYYATNGEALRVYDIQGGWGMQTTLDECSFVNERLDSKSLQSQEEADIEERHFVEWLASMSGGDVHIYSAGPKTDEDVRADTRLFLKNLQNEARRSNTWEVR